MAVRFLEETVQRFLSEQDINAFQMEYREVFDTIRRGQDTRYQDSLGWFHTLRYAGEAQLEAIMETADRVRTDGDAFVIVGVGGSNQAARAVIESLGSAGGMTVYYAGNTLSPYNLTSVLRELKDKSVYVNVIAKNFSTLEPGISFRMLRRFLTEKYGSEAGRRVIVTGTPGSELEAISRREGYTFLEFPEDIGGRYSAFSSVGIFPMAVAGVDIRKLVQGAVDMERKLLEDGSFQNMAFRYASIRNLLARQGKQIEILSFFEPRLKFFAKWWVQLFAESEGKQGKGIYPSACEMSEELHSVGQFIQDGSPILFETFLQVMDSGAEYCLTDDEVEDGFHYLNNRELGWVNQVAYQATMQAHGEHLPCISLTVDRLDEYHYGQLFYFFMFSCYLSGSFMKVNPFDQPGVENYKRYMFQELQKVV